MTRPNLSCLVVDGSEIKLRLEAERLETGDCVHVDWLRFTCNLRHSPCLSDIDAFWETPDSFESVWDERYRMSRLLKTLSSIQDGDYLAGVQAAELCREVAECLGDEFQPAAAVEKGHDFYKFRIPIERAGTECGWVGFLASGDSPRQSAQARTLHVNLFGAACTFAAAGWRDRVAALIDRREGVITRVDLAADFFDGLPGGMEGVVSEYDAGLCDVKGARPKYSQLGRWASDAGERSFYLGSKAAGKQTNVYEKGHQLFGAESGSAWVRIELRYGNKLRVLGSDCLRRPADFFAGASPWHLAKLELLQTVAAVQACPQSAKLAIQTVDAEVSRLIRWARNTAGPTIAALWEHSGDQFLQFVVAARKPGRISGFTSGDIGAAFKRQLNIREAGPAFA